MEFKVINKSNNVFNTAEKIFIFAFFLKVLSISHFLTLLKTVPKIAAAFLLQYLTPCVCGMDFRLSSQLISNKFL